MTVRGSHEADSSGSPNDTHPGDQTERRARELAALLEVSRVVASSLDLGEVLGAILDQLGSITEHTGASIVLYGEDSFEFAEARSVTGTRARIGATVPFAVAPRISSALRRGEAVIIGDVRADEPLATDYRAIIETIGVPDRPPFNVIRSWMAVPLSLRDRVTGALTISWTEPDYFTAEHARLARAFADQAAVAIENARLYEQAQEHAASEERQRLARELHDSVSQALYGIALGARTAKTLIERDPPAAAEPVDYILSLAEAGLAEMRALIFELRPESLETEGLVAAITKSADAVAARHGIRIEFGLGEEPEIPIETKEALYRICQEAMTNVIKHAQASGIEVQLAQGGDRITLTVADEGTGFDAEASFPGHIGLHSMRERAERVGGEVTIESVRGKGTRVTASVPV